MNALRKLYNIAGPKLQHRKVSEHAKKYGYEMKPYWEEAKVNKVKVFSYLAASAYLIYDIGADRKKHMAIFMQNYDANKKYFESKDEWDVMYKPNMDFLVDQVFPPPLGDGKESGRLSVEDKDFCDDGGPKFFGKKFDL